MADEWAKIPADIFRALKQTFSIIVLREARTAIFSFIAKSSPFRKSGNVLPRKRLRARDTAAAESAADRTGAAAFSRRLKFRETGGIFCNCYNIPVSL
jgi:hypothetical protein